VAGAGPGVAGVVRGAAWAAAADGTAAAVRGVGLPAAFGVGRPASRCGTGDAGRAAGPVGAAGAAGVAGRAGAGAAAAGAASSGEVVRMERRVRAGASGCRPGTWYGVAPPGRPSGPTADTGWLRSARREVLAAAAEAPGDGAGA
jgi:hypothetical protein